MEGVKCLWHAFSIQTIYLHKPRNTPLSHPKNLHRHCFRFLLRHLHIPGEIANNHYQEHKVLGSKTECIMGFVNTYVELRSVSLIQASWYCWLGNFLNFFSWLSSKVKKKAKQFQIYNKIKTTVKCRPEPPLTLAFDPPEPSDCTARAHRSCHVSKV